MTPFARALITVIHRWKVGSLPDTALEKAICEATQSSYFMAKWLASRIRNHSITPTTLTGGK